MVGTQEIVAMAEPVTLELLGELMHRALTELRDIKDQMLVHGAILVRLESRIPLPTMLNWPPFSCKCSATATAPC